LSEPAVPIRCTHSAGKRDAIAIDKQVLEFYGPIRKERKQGFKVLSDCGAPCDRWKRGSVGHSGVVIKAQHPPGVVSVNGLHQFAYEFGSLLACHGSTCLLCIVIPSFPSNGRSNLTRLISEATDAHPHWLHLVGGLFSRRDWRRAVHVRHFHARCRTHSGIGCP